jgi:hypothetical protein
MMSLPGTYEHCMGGHYYAVVRGDEECPVCARIAELEARVERLTQAGNQYISNLVARCDSQAALIVELREALNVLKEDYADSEGCYCGQLVGGCNAEGQPMGRCGFCKARAVIAKVSEVSA